MNLYTFIMEFRGGTYIDQVMGTNIDEAIITWANTLKVDEIKYLSTKTKQQLIDELPDEIADGMIGKIATVENVWLFVFLFHTGAARIHIIKTCTDDDNK